MACIKRGSQRDILRLKGCLIILYYSVYQCCINLEFSFRFSLNLFAIENDKSETPVTGFVHKRAQI